MIAVPPPLTNLTNKKATKLTNLTSQRLSSFQTIKTLNAWMGKWVRQLTTLSIKTFTTIRSLLQRLSKGGLITILSIMTSRITASSIRSLIQTLSVMTLSIRGLIMTINIMTVSIMMLSIRGLI
jgi:hypothetical protein